MTILLVFLVQVPLPKQVSEQKVETINPEKDVDGFHQLILENCILMSKPLYHVHPGYYGNFKTRRY